MNDYKKEIIELMRDRPLLWDPKNPEYHNSDQRKQVWEYIDSKCFQLILVPDNYNQLVVDQEALGFSVSHMFCIVEEQCLISTCHQGTDSSMKLSSTFPQ
ncbi:hypothetical protein PoB_003198500 [Plakobranchus ocellatus]|uniref:MADF domain-containing protein n=1 Tax=Plakobranchus ocellatus TaxID=259542 RepID=A0AAV4ADN4_9GAST|nr:hypothetical protein PoB_003198500 [Plakobranchus ocellatus]